MYSKRIASRPERHGYLAGSRASLGGLTDGRND